MKQKTRAWLGAIVAGKLATAAQADYPGHPIDMVIPFGAAGATDTSARTISAPLGAAVGKPHVMVPEDHESRRRRLSIRHA